MDYLVVGTFKSLQTVRVIWSNWGHCFRRDIPLGSMYRNHGLKLETAATQATFHLTEFGVVSRMSPLHHKLAHKEGNFVKFKCQQLLLKMKWIWVQEVYSVHVSERCELFTQKVKLRFIIREIKVQCVKMLQAAKKKKKNPKDLDPEKQKE